MEILDSNIVDGKGLFVKRNIKEGEIVYTLSGKIYDHPTRETIHIGNNVHIYDEHGIFINHSFTPNVRINRKNVVALKDIKENEEITFNYNTSEMEMSNKFYVGTRIVEGNKHLNKFIDT